LGYSIDIKGVVLYKKTVLGKFNKINGEYTFDISKKNINKHSQYYYIMM